jgi:hypothetical protein
MVDPRSVILCIAVNEIFQDSVEASSKMNFECVRFQAWVPIHFVRGFRAHGESGSSYCRVFRLPI